MEQRVTLIHKTTAELQWMWSSPLIDGSQFLCVILFNPNFKAHKFNAFEYQNGERCYGYTLSNLERILDAPKGLSCIEMLSSYSTENQTSKFWTQMEINGELLTSLCSLCSEPIICVECEITIGDTKVNLNSETELATAKPFRRFETAMKTVKRDFPINKAAHITYTVFLKWNVWKLPVLKKHGSTVLHQLFHNRTLGDCCIVTGEETEVKCHGFIMTENSDVLNRMLNCGLQESQTKRIELRDLSDEVVTHFLSYLYEMEVSRFQLNGVLALELFQLGHVYNIACLEKDMAVSLLNIPERSIPINVGLEIYLFTMRLEQFHALTDKAIEVLRKVPTDVVSSSTFQDLLEKNPREAAKLAVKLLELGSD